MLNPTLRILSAGSLRAVLTAHATARGGGVELVFGPAGLLRERIEQGEACDLFLSASMEHPQVLARRRAGVATRFARNRLVATARREIRLRPENFLDRLLAPDIRIGTSTPLADPSGDYAYAMFARAEAIRPGAGASLAARAVHLVGGREPSKAPAGVDAVTHFLGTGDVDLFLGYQTSARGLAARFDIVVPPPALQVMAEYGLLVVATDGVRRREADEFAASLLAPAGQARLVEHGFEAAD